MKSRTRLGYCRQVQDENAGRSSMLVVCRKISSTVWKIFSTMTLTLTSDLDLEKFIQGPNF